VTKNNRKWQTSIYDEMIVDNFAGGGGASTGIELATGRPVDVAINHDPDAISMHMRNHPYTRHYCENVWEVDPRKVSKGRSVALVWLSPDCTHHSKARGGKPVKKEIRGLAWVAIRWAATVRPRVIALENVEEFQDWGPLDNAGLPIKAKKGETFRNFVKEFEKLGYKVDWKELRACDYGAPTIRKRLFLIARCDEMPITWPEPTHASPDSKAVKSGLLKPWRSAAEIIDWSHPCPSIFATSEEIWQEYGLRAIRPLAENTMERIARGIKRFVIDEPDPFVLQMVEGGGAFKYKGGIITKVNHGGDGFRGQSVNDPLQTITGKHGFGLTMPVMRTLSPLTESNTTGSTGKPANKPLNTIRTTSQILITPTLVQYHDEQGKKETRGQSVERPMLTLDTNNRYGLVMPFLSKYYAGNYKGDGNHMTDPLNTVTAIDHNALVTSQLTIFRNNCIGSDMRDPVGTIMTSPGHFGEVRALLQKYYGSDTESVGLVKVCGQVYAITDIGLRMLTPRELFNAQGFPPDYIIDVGSTGVPLSKAKQVAKCGNSVPPVFAEAIVRANLPELCGRRIETMAELMNEMAG
jgi:DNA (cytosine-5)-methyltransferase 1